MYTHMHVHTHTHTHTHTLVHTYTCTHTRTHAYTHARTHAYTHAHTHTYTHKKCSHIFTRCPVTQSNLIQALCIDSSDSARAADAFGLPRQFSSSDDGFEAAFRYKRRQQQQQQRLHEEGGEGAHDAQDAKRADDVRV